MSTLSKVKRAGIPRGEKLYPSLDAQIQAYIERGVPNESGCLIYPTIRRYPTIRYEGIQRRFGQWLLIVRGESSSGVVARHTCDNSRCVNPDHIIAGTQRDNNHDQIARGRGNHILQGKGRCRKLTAEQAVELRQLHETSNYTSSQLASLFHIAESSVYVYLTRPF